MDDGSPEILITAQHMTDFGRQSQGGKEGREIYIYILSLVGKYCLRNNIRLKKEEKKEK